MDILCGKVQVCKTNDGNVLDNLSRSKC